MSPCKLTFYFNTINVNFLQSTILQPTTKSKQEYIVYHSIEQNGSGEILKKDFTCNKPNIDLYRFVTFQSNTPSG